MQPSYDETFTFAHLVIAAEDCVKNVRWKQSVQCFETNMYMHCAGLTKELNERRYKSKGFTTFFITERGKTRKIQSVHITERVVQKCLCNYALKPILLPSLIYDNCASQKGKGQDFAVKRFREHLRWHIARYGKKGGVYLADFHNFFGSIDHEILLKLLREKIKDNEIYDLTAYFINCFDGDKGLGLGSEVSQICAIFYPNKIDHLVKEKYGVHTYERYMDDIAVISDDIEKLKAIDREIRECAKELKIEMNEKHTQIYRFEDNPTFTFLKCRTKIGETGKISMRLVPDNTKRRKRFIKKLRCLYDDGLVDYKYASQSNGTWLSYAKKRKNSYLTVKSVKAFFTEMFGEDEMYEKEYIKDQKRINQRLFYIEQKINKLMTAAKIDHEILKTVENETGKNKSVNKRETV